MDTGDAVRVFPTEAACRAANRSRCLHGSDLVFLVLGAAKLWERRMVPQMAAWGRESGSRVYYLVERQGVDTVVAASRNASAGGGLWASSDRSSHRRVVPPAFPCAVEEGVHETTPGGEQRRWTVLRCGSGGAAAEGGRVLAAHACTGTQHMSTSCKAQAALQFIVARLGGVKWVVLVDDDAFINVPTLLSTLADLNPDEPIESNAYGCCPGAFRPRGMCRAVWTHARVNHRKVRFAKHDSLPCPPVPRVVSAMSRGAIAALAPALAARDALLVSDVLPPRKRADKRLEGDINLRTTHDTKLGTLLWQAHVKIYSRLKGAGGGRGEGGTLHHRSSRLVPLYRRGGNRTRGRFKRGSDRDRGKDGARRVRPPRSGPPAVVHVHYKDHVPLCAGLASERYLGCAAMELRRVFREVWPAHPVRPQRAGAWAKRDACDAVDRVHRQGQYKRTRHYRDVQRHCAEGAWRPYRASDLDCGAHALAGDGGVAYLAKADNATLARHVGNVFALRNDKFAVVEPGRGSCDALGPEQW